MTSVVPPLGAVVVVRSVIARKLELIPGNRETEVGRGGRLQKAACQKDRKETPLHSGIIRSVSEQPTARRPRFRTVANENAIPIEADDLIALARRYADQGMFDESIHLYEMAEKLKPGTMDLRVDMARVRDLKREAEESRIDNVWREV